MFFGWFLLSRIVQGSAGALDPASYVRAAFVHRDSGVDSNQGAYPATMNFLALLERHSVCRLDALTLTSSSRYFIRKVFEVEPSIFRAHQF